jgi:hypothetical protein
MTGRTDRRTLAQHPTQAAAVQSTLGPEGWLRKASAVEVVHQPRWPGDDRPWAVTAAKQ